MKFLLYGYEFYVPEGKEKYNEIRKKFDCLAKNAAKNFGETYKRQNSNIEDVIKKAPEQFAESINEVIEYCVDVLLSNNIFSVDVDTFCNSCGDLFDYWFQIYYKIADEVAELKYSQEQLDEYRVMRRKLRGKIIGGGFGVSGAIKGMATAGAMNAVIGVGHMLFNGLGKAITSISTASAMNKIFKNPNTFILLRNAVYHTAFSTHLVMVKYLNDNLNEEILIPSVEDVKLGQIYANNALKLSNSDEFIEIILNSIILNPYNDAPYKLLLRRFGDKNSQLDKLAKYFNIKIDSIKADYIEEQFETELWKSSTNDFKRKKEILEMLINFTQIKGEKSEKYYEMIYELDKQIRTVLGVTLDTLADVEASSCEVEGLDLIIKNIKWDDIYSLIDARKNIRLYNSPLAKKLYDDVNNVYKHLEDEFCKVDMGWGLGTAKCISLEDAIKTKDMSNQITYRLKNSNLCDKNTLKEHLHWIATLDLQDSIKNKYCDLISQWIKNSEYSVKGYKNFSNKKQSSILNVLINVIRTIISIIISIIVIIVFLSIFIE